MSLKGRMYLYSSSGSALTGHLWQLWLEISAFTGVENFIHCLRGSLIIFFLFFFSAAILDDPMECSRGERLAITLAKDNINRNSNRSTTGKLEVDIFELLRDSEYEMGETSKWPIRLRQLGLLWLAPWEFTQHVNHVSWMVNRSSSAGRSE